MSLLQTFEAHGCEVQVGGLERELAYLYVLLDRKVLSKITISIVMSANSLNFIIHHIHHYMLSHALWSSLNIRAVLRLCHAHKHLIAQRKKTKIGNFQNLKGSLVWQKRTIGNRRKGRKLLHLRMKRTLLMQNSLAGHINSNMSYS